MNAPPPDAADSGRAISVARAFMDVASYDRAAQVVSQALSAHPDDPNLLVELARAEIGLRRHQSAAEHVHAALAVQPRSAYALMIYAMALDGLHRRGEAIGVAYQAVLAAPDLPVAHRIYAGLLHDDRHSAQALTVVAEALRLDPNDADSWVLRARILQDLRRAAEAETAFAEALRLRPDHALAVHNRAVNQLRIGKLSRGSTGLVGAARLDPSLGGLARRNLGVVAALGLRRVTLAATVLSVAVIFVVIVVQAGDPSVVPRVISGVGAAVVAALLIVALRLVPRVSWPSVLRSHPWVVVRIAHAVCGIGIGAVAAAVGGPEDLLAVGGVLLLFGGVGIRFIGGLAGM